MFVWMYFSRWYFCSKINVWMYIIIFSISLQANFIKKMRHLLSCQWHIQQNINQYICLLGLQQHLLKSKLFFAFLINNSLASYNTLVSTLRLPWCFFSFATGMWPVCWRQCPAFWHMSHCLCSLSYLTSSLNFHLCLRSALELYVMYVLDFWSGLVLLRVQWM